LKIPEARRDANPQRISESEFKERFKNHFVDPAFDKLRDKIDEMASIAWAAKQDSRKAPNTQKAGPGYANPSYELSREWIKARKAIDEAAKVYADAMGPDRILIISGSDRNDQTCPQEISKSSRLVAIARDTLEKEKNIAVETLDLSLITSQYGKNIFPCKGCVSTAMPLCHFPCSCYPNHSLGQVNDWMNEIYPMWVAAHGILIVTPVYWYQAPGALKLMMDRLVCADGGNPDPTSTNGKDAKIAKEMELNGWPFPRHLEGRIFSLIVHGDSAGIDSLRDALTDWMRDMRLIPAGPYSVLDRYIGYFEPYATNHVALDKDEGMQAETRIASLALARTVRAKREGKLDGILEPFPEPRAK